MARKRLKSDLRRRRQQQAKAATAAEPTPAEREQQRILATGRDCLRRIKNDRGYEDWRAVGAALMVITQQTLDELEEDEWNGGNKQLVNEFHRNWLVYEAGAGSNRKPLSKQERWALRQLMTNPQIHAWRASLDDELQRQLTHPNTVVNKWKREAQIADPNENQFKEACTVMINFTLARNRDEDISRLVEPAYDTWVGGFRLPKRLGPLAQWITRLDNACQAKLNDPEEGEALRERVRFKDRIRLRREFDDRRGRRAKKRRPSIFRDVQLEDEDDEDEE
jgi:hypothetical protein